MPRLLRLLRRRHQHAVKEANRPAIPAVDAVRVPELVHGLVFWVLGEEPPQGLIQRIRVGGTHVTDTLLIH